MTPSFFTDSHTHLNSPQLYPDYRTHIQDFLDVGGIGLSIIGTELEDSKMAVDIVKRGKSEKAKKLTIGATIGIHPEFASQYSKQEDLDEAMQQLEQLYLDNKQYVIGIGEIGTDMYHEDYRPFHQEQKKLFHAQCELAQKYNLPIVIHSRADFEGTMEALRSIVWTHGNTSNNNPLKIYFHCRGYTTKELEVLNGEFYSGELYIGFCGNISYPKAQELRDSFQYCLNHGIKVLIETDAPYLAAQAIRGQQNTPAKIIHTYDFISDYFDYFNKDSDNLKHMTYTNFMSLYFPHVHAS